MSTVHPRMCGSDSMKQRGILCFNLSRQYEDEQWGFILPKEAVAPGLHGGAMAERGGSPEWGLVCAMVYGFQRFQAQIKVEVEGSSPLGIPQHVVRGVGHA
jgi:hypothetical protein